jgi:hypothetical protein
VRPLFAEKRKIHAIFAHIVLLNPQQSSDQRGKTMDIVNSIWFAIGEFSGI